jgi:hypothetical protein
MTHRTGPVFIRLVRNLFVIALVVLMVPSLSLFAQSSIQTSMPAGTQAALPSAPTPNTPQMLSIVILDGEDALNNIRERTAREPIVQVEDENHKPVAGAVVLFTLHSGASGAGGSFGNLTSLSVTTGADGRATAHGLKPNASEGSYTISVTASVGAVVATEVVIHQINAANGASSSSASSTSSASQSTGVASKIVKRPYRLGHLSGHTLVLAGAIAAGVAVVAVTVVMARQTVPAVITPGTGTVGKP